MRTLCAFVLAFPVISAAEDSDSGFPNPDDYLYDESSLTDDAFRFSQTLGDQMVLQRAPASAVVWGFAPKGTEVVTSFNGRTYPAVIADDDNVWRTTLDPTKAGGPYNITSESSLGVVALSDVLFGDVYVCGGQSNMAHTLNTNENKDSYAEEADNYPNIRLFTVGQKTSSNTPLLDLNTVQQPWIQASKTSALSFSGVCWFFGKNVFDGLDKKVPIGLVSSNWGGTPVEHWMSPETSSPCGHESDGTLYNAMIHPYTVGPMSVSGFTWYQGEADLGGNPTLPAQNRNYTCTQAAMITQWRQEFKVPNAFYAIVQLSTWHPNPDLLAELRDQQLATEDLIPNSNFAYATNADFGAGGNIHPPYKQHPGKRLANAALAINNQQPITWRSPTYASAMATAPGEVTVELHDVGGAGLVSKPPFNLLAESDCAGLNAKAPRTCAWAELQFDDADRTWVNASVTVHSNKMSMVLTAEPPAGADGIVASSYGWGAVPMMTVYRADMDGDDGQLPVLTWKRNLTSSQSVLV